MYARVTTGPVAVEAVVEQFRGQQGQPASDPATTPPGLVSRIALLEDGGRVVLLPYLPLAWQPLAVAPPAATAAAQIALERDAWSEEQRRFVLQAAILSPYRNVACPVSVSVSGRMATVSLSLVRPEALGLVERSLRSALEERERSRPDLPAPPA